MVGTASRTVFLIYSNKRHENFAQLFVAATLARNVNIVREIRLEDADVFRKEALCRRHQ